VNTDNRLELFRFPLLLFESIACGTGDLDDDGSKVGDVGVVDAAVVAVAILAAFVKLDICV
jgi:hypothetical protein